MKDIQEARGHNYFPSYVGQSLEHKELRKYLLLELFIMSANTLYFNISYILNSVSIIPHSLLTSVSIKPQNIQQLARPNMIIFLINHLFHILIKLGTPSSFICYNCVEVSSCFHLFSYSYTVGKVDFSPCFLLFLSEYVLFLLAEVEEGRRV